MSRQPAVSIPDICSRHLYHTETENKKVVCAPLNSPIIHTINGDFHWD